MSRKENLSNLIAGPYHRGLYNRLGSKELAIMADFLEFATDLDRDEYALAVERMFLDKPKTKNWAVIQELLGAAGSSK